MTPTTSVSLKIRAAALLLLLGLSACPIKWKERCDPSLFTTPDACGCARTRCEAGEGCFAGKCLPKDTYGCSPACQPGEVCNAGRCCDPKKASNRKDCGCQGECASPEDCVSTAEGWACQCIKERAYNDAYCGCDRAPNGEVRKCNTEQGLGCGFTPDTGEEAVCRCDITNKINLYNNEKCGCRDKCPTGSTCQGGLCVCDNPDKKICAGVCKFDRDCTCDPSDRAQWPDWALRDSRNCGCAGPCAVGNYCKDGACVCDPQAHDRDNTNCGCGGICGGPDGPPKTCIGGRCICDPRSLNDSSRCGCDGIRCQEDEICTGGACVCDPDRHAFDFSQCGCGPPCASGYRCINKVCQCYPDDYAYDDNNCGCAGRCPEGTWCVKKHCEQKN